MSAGLGEICRDYFKVFEKQAADFRDDPSVSRKIARRETETALWLMRKFAKEGPDDLLCGLRRSALRRYGSVLFSPAPFRLKLKLTGLALMSHVYLALLRRRTVPENA